MSKEQPTKNEQLFLQLVTSYSAGAWIGLGKMKNPVTDTFEPNRKQAAFSIDMLVMLRERLADNLADWEVEYLNKVIDDLKMSYVTGPDQDVPAGGSADNGQSENLSTTKDEDRGE